MYILFHEMFDTFLKAKTKEDKIHVLQQFAVSRGGSRLPELLNAAFNPTVKFDIAKVPAYKPSPLPAGLNDSYLHQELGKLYLFIENHPRRTAKLTAKKEQSILAQILSYLHPGEASILAALLQKKLSDHIPGLTASLVKEAFPQLPFEVTGKSAPQKKITKTKKTA